MMLILFGGFLDSSVDKETACNAGDSDLIPGSGRSAGEGFGYPLQYPWVSFVAQLVKNLPAMWETWVQSLGWEDPLEKGKYLIFIYSVRECSNFIDIPIAIQLYQHHLLKRLSFLYCIFSLLCCRLTDHRYMHVCSIAKSLLTLCNLINCSLPCFSVHGIFQARILEWVTISFSRGTSWPRVWTWVSCVSCIGRQILYHWTPWDGGP